MKTTILITVLTALLPLGSLCDAAEPAPKQTAELGFFDSDPSAESTPEPAEELLTLDASEVPLSDLIEAVSHKHELTANFVFVGDAGKVRIPGIRLRDVSWEALLDVISHIAPVEVDRVDDPVSGGRIYLFRKTAPDPVGPAPAPADSEEGKASGMVEAIYGASESGVPDPAVKQTRAFLTRDLDLGKHELAEAIAELWAMADPKWEVHGNKLRYHEETGMLIATADPTRMIELEGLLEEFRKGGEAETRTEHRTLLAELEAARFKVEQQTTKLEQELAAVKLENRRLKEELAASRAQKQE